MKRVALYVEGGVAEEVKLVTRGIIPPFQVWPKVIVWGSRIFHFAWIDGAGVGLYEEAFTVALVLDEEGRYFGEQAPAV